ncbi:hypothetical protein C8R42DRAFT_580586, partial [Lentinula raphanica]
MQDQFFGDFLKALTIINDKKARDVGLQGMKMPPMLAELGEIIEMISPQAFRVLKEYIPLPNRRTLQRHRAQVPKFPVDINERTFELAWEHVKKIGLQEGPYIICVDDTELQPAIRPFYDADRDAYCLLGSTGKPLTVANPEEFHEALKDALVEKATKLRLFCLQPLCPGAAAYVLAAKGISKSLKVPELFSFTWDILQGLWERKIHVIGYSCDG